VEPSQCSQCHLSVALEPPRFADILEFNFS
jgi:hypothetical protein